MNKDFQRKIVPLDRLKVSLPDVVDLFICSASYEERCLSIPLSLDVSNVGQTIVLQNDSVLGKGQIHKDRLLDFFGDNAELVIISKDLAIKTADRIIQKTSLYETNADFKCYVDITSMTHETLLILYRALQEVLMKCANITFLYTPAKEYDPGVELEKKWLSRGIKGVRSVLGFPGELRPSRKSHLIVLVGFEVERSRKLIESYEPSTLSLGIGDDDPIHQGHLKVNAHKFERLKNAYPDAGVFSFSPKDAYKVRDAILRVVDGLQGQNVLIAPMNTKISTLGVALAATERPDLQICYGPAVTYNVGNYSSPDDHCYIFQL